MNPYLGFVKSFKNAIEAAAGITAESVSGVGTNGSSAVKAMIFSPHPDDECIVGGLALRLSQQSNVNTVNVAVTQGSNKERQQPRLEELRNACVYLGFDLLQTGPAGLENVNLKTRENDPEFWKGSVDVIKGILLEKKPGIIFIPHSGDWNSSHIGTHYLVMDALAEIGSELSCTVVESEYWGAMDDPNLMVELSEEQVAELIAALSLHVGEVSRNPYHLSLPAWLQDNVRRGGELVGGQGGDVPSFLFATLYRVSVWKDGSLQRAKGGIVSVQDDPLDVLK